MTTAIVVLAFNRPDALARLLSSLDRAYYPSQTSVPLVISLDQGSSPSARASAAVAHGFEWRFGSKLVIEHPDHLGVARHFRTVGDLTREYGAAILLEDDLTVAPPFYQYATQVLDAYADDPRIAGFCLYGLWFNGFTHEPFLPIDDGADVSFLRLPYTQGLCFSVQQWDAFAAWRAAVEVASCPELHPAFLRFGPDEWFPDLAAYLASSDRFFCFPGTSLTVGWGDAGAHFAESTSWFQTPIQLGQPQLRLPALDEVKAVYDGFFELLPDRLASLAPALQGQDFDVDLNATKRPANLRTDHVLTARPVRKAVASFGLTMYPPELNVMTEVPGREISLAHRDDVYWDSWAEVDARRRLHTYHQRRNRSSRRRSLRFMASRAIGLLRRW
jgi:GNT-I family